MPVRRLSPLYSVAAALVLIFGLGFLGYSFFKLDYEWDFRALGAFFGRTAHPG